MLMYATGHTVGNLLISIPTMFFLPDPAGTGITPDGRYKDMASWGGQLDLGTSLYSPQGHVRLSMQSDGNLVLCESVTCMLLYF